MAKISELRAIAPTGKEQVVLFDGEETVRAFLSELKLDDATGSLLTSAILADVLIAVPIAGDASALRVDLDTAANGETFDVLIVAGNSKAVTRLTAGGITRDVVGPGAVPIAAGDLGRGKIATFSYSIGGGGFVLLGQRELSIAGSAPSSTYDDDFAERPWGSVSFPGGVRKVDRLTKYVVVPGSSNANAAYVPAAQMPASVAAAALNEFFPGEDMIFSGITAARPGAPMVDIASQLADSIPYQAGQAGWVIPFFWMNDARTLFYHDQGGILAEIDALRRMIPAIRTKGAEPVLVTGFPPDPRASDVALDPNYYADVGANAGMTFPAVKAAPVNPETDMYPPKSGQLTTPTAWTVTGIKRTGYKRIEHVNRLIRELASETGCVLLDLEYSTYRHVIETVADLGAGLDTYYNQADPLHPKPALYDAAVTPVLREWAAAVARGDTSQRIFRGDANATALALIAFNQARAETTIAMAAAIASASGEADRAGRNSQQAGVSATAAQTFRDQTGVLADQAKTSAASAVSIAAIVAATSNEVFASRDTVYSLAGITRTYVTAAAMFADALPPANAFVQVLVDSTYGNRRTVYQNQGGALKRVSADAPLSIQHLWVDPTAGDDTTGNGSKASPYRTFKKALAQCAFGDTVQTVAGAVIREDFQYIPIPAGVTVLGSPGGLTFSGMDPVTMAQAAPSGTGFIRRIAHLWGGLTGLPGDTSKNNGNRWYCRLQARKGGVVYDMRNLWVGNPQAEYPWIMASADEAKAFALSTPGYFYAHPVSNDGSSYASGYSKGDYDYYFCPPLGDDPTTYAWQVGQRLAPMFDNPYCTLKNATIWGGVGHNGLNMGRGRVEDVTILYPAAHAGFFPGATTIRLRVAHMNYSQGTAYGLHHFGAEANFATQRHTLHIDTVVTDWAGTVMGCHGSSGGDVIDYIEMTNPRFERVGSVGDVGACRSGVFMRDVVAKDVGMIGGFGTDLSIDGLKIATSGRGGTHGTFAGCIGRTFRLSNAEGYTNDILFAQEASHGPMIFERSNLIGEGSWPNGYCGIVDSPAGLTIDQCTFQINSGSESGYGMVIRNSNNYPIRVTQSAIHGVGGISNGANGKWQEGYAGLSTDGTCVFTGHSGMSRTPNVSAPIDYHPDSTAHDLGTVMVGVTTGASMPYRNNGTYWALTNRGIYDAGYQMGVPSSQNGFPAKGDVLRGLMFSPSNSRLYAYGDAGLLYVSGNGPQYTMQKVATGLTKNFLCAWAQHIDPASTVLLGCSDGSITKIVSQDTPTAPLIAQIATPVTWPIRAIAKDDDLPNFLGGTKMVAVGSDRDNTVGGGICSLDGGATWQSIASLASTKLKAVGFMPGPNIWAAFGHDEEMWTATDPAGAWTQHYFNINAGLSDRNNPPGNIESVAFDTSLKRIGFLGAVSRGRAGATGQTFGYVQASDANPRNWRVIEKDPPMPSMKSISWGYQIGDGGVAVRPRFIATSTQGRWAVSLDMVNWHRTVTQRFNPEFQQQRAVETNYYASL